MWWPFGPSPNDSSSPSSSSSLSSPSISETGTPVTQPAAKLPTPVKQGLTRDEQANLDFAELLKEIEIEQAKEQERRDQVRKGPSRSTPTTIDIAPDALYPTEMSCRSALDYAMFCQSFGGQFVHVYRYGEFRSCKNHWSDFWLCMRTRNWDEKDRAAAIQSHYKTKAVQWKSGPSSEDIWEVRTEPVRDAFQDSLEDLEAKIAAWKQANPDVLDPWDKRQGSTFNNPPLQLETSTLSLERYSRFGRDGLNSRRQNTLRSTWLCRHMLSCFIRSLHTLWSSFHLPWRPAFTNGPNLQ